MKKSLRYRTSHLLESQFESGSRGRVLEKHNKRQIQLLAFFLSFLGCSNLAHLLFYFLGKFRIFDMNALYSSRRCDAPLDQESAHFRIFEIGICFQKRFLFHY